MIASEEIIPSKIRSQDLQPLFMQKNLKIDITKLNIQSVRDFHPAFNNTFICVDVQANMKRVVHFTLDGKLLGELIIKQPQYQLFMMAENLVNVLEYCPKKPQSLIIQWNLETHQTISNNYNREILPMVKVFTFSQSQTFCIVQYDHHTQNPEHLNKLSPQIHKQLPETEQPSYHTKFKLAYFKFPLRKSHQKPYMVFKTHTNPKQYGFYQKIIKLNEHSMIGSLSIKMNQHDQTLLKTFDFKNNTMGIEINYKFNVQINYKKELLQIWITDMWEITSENFYLKCQLRIDKEKIEKNHSIKYINEAETLQECLYLKWAYKTDNSLKFTKIKTPLNSQIQFIDGFNEKERVRNVINKPFNNNKVQSYNTYTRSLEHLPLYYVNNTTQQVLMVDKLYLDWPISFPAYNHRMAIYFKSHFGIKQSILQIVMHRVESNLSLREIATFWLTQILPEPTSYDLIKSAVLLLQDWSKDKLQGGWYLLDMNKIYRQRSITPVYR